jgi:heme/copper-type cytochrome/quinol oxidase subunit 3
VSGAQHRLRIGPVFTVSAYYWHFVDAVWLAVFATIFIVQ